MTIFFGVEKDDISRKGRRCEMMGWCERASGELGKVGTVTYRYCWAWMQEGVKRWRGMRQSWKSQGWECTKWEKVWNLVKAR